MLIAHQHFAHDDSVKRAARFLDAFHLHTQHGDAVGQLFGRPIEVDIFLEPIVRDFHGG